MVRVFYQISQDDTIKNLKVLRSSRLKILSYHSVSGASEELSARLSVEPDGLVHRVDVRVFQR